MEESPTQLHAGFIKAALFVSYVLNNVIVFDKSRENRMIRLLEKWQCMWNEKDDFFHHGVNELADEQLIFEEESELNLLAAKLLVLPEHVQEESLYLQTSFGDPPDYYREYQALIRQAVEKRQWLSPSSNELARRRFMFAVNKWCLLRITEPLSGFQRNMLSWQGQNGEAVKWFDVVNRLSKEFHETLFDWHCGFLDQLTAFSRITGYRGSVTDECLSFYFPN